MYENNFSLFPSDNTKSFVDDFLFEEERDMFSDLNLLSCTDVSEELMKTDLDFEPSSSLYEQSKQMYIDLDYESDILCYEVSIVCHFDLVDVCSLEIISFVALQLKIDKSKIFFLFFFLVIIS